MKVNLMLLGVVELDFGGVGESELDVTGCL